MVGRAVIAQADMWFATQSFEDSLGDTGLADAGLAGDQHDAAVATFGLLPAPHQELDLLIPADQRRSGRPRNASNRLVGGARADAPARPAPDHRNP